MFKVGDKVIVRKNLNNIARKLMKQNPGINWLMVRQEGKIRTICNINIYKNIIYYKLSEDIGKWSWVEEYLKKIDELKMDIE